MGEDIFEPDSVFIEKFEHLGCKIILNDERIFTCSFFRETYDVSGQYALEQRCNFPGNSYTQSGEVDRERYQEQHASPTPCSLETVTVCPQIIAVYHRYTLRNAPNQVIERDGWFIPIVEGEPSTDQCY